MRRTLLICLGIIMLGVIAWGLGSFKQTPAEPRPAAIYRPNRADALNCVVNRELRRLDGNSHWLPENGYSDSDCPSPKDVRSHPTIMVPQ